eukprot:TRINITY_DN5087_c1_g1_i1.p1 TRINITY_DN5087_c1_g1~~TRINITY_DN5087_c1_g1_i1.p1  ORF type:complete len:211 (-),score=48.32 TRINITY_DN5087_c1_g1_i1:331-936(-)
MEETEQVRADEPWLEKWVEHLLFHDVRSWVSENYALIWCVLFGLVVLYVLYERVLQRLYASWMRWREETRTLSEQEKARLIEMEENRRIARLKQQQQTRELGAVAEEKRKEREREKRLQKLAIVENKYNGNGRPLGTDDDTDAPTPSSSSSSSSSCSSSRSLGGDKNSKSTSRSEWSPLWGSSGGGGGYRPSGFKRPSGGG